MRARLLLAALSAAALVSGGADARAAKVGTVDAYCFRGSCDPPGSVTFDAAPGERNVVTIRLDDEQHIVIHDAGAPLTVGGRCTALDERTARCERPGYDTEVRLGDGDDELTAHDEVGVLAGPGDDVVRAGHVDRYDSGYMYGGPGDDALDASQANYYMLTGGPGDDRLTGSSSGWERLAPGPGADVVDGGGGDGDQFVHGDRGVPLRLSLALGRGSEDPQVTGIEHVSGGSGADRLVGGDGPEKLMGWGGDDVLVGGGGEDHVEGGEGTDRIAGGRGDDRLFGQAEPFSDDAYGMSDRSDRLAGAAGDDLLDGGPRPDRIACGRGRDTVAAADGDALPGRRPGRATDCERLNFRATRPGSFCMALDDVVRRGSRLRVGDACPNQRGLQVARGVELLGAGGASLARGTAAPIGRWPLTLGLTPAGRPLLRQGRAHDVRVRVRRVGSLGRTSSWTTVRVALAVRRAG